MPEGRLCWREGRRICFEWCRRKRKGRFSCQRGAFAGERGAVSALNGAVISEWALFVPETRLHWQKGHRICLKGRTHVRKEHLFVPEGRPYWRKGHRIYLEGAVEGKMRLFVP